MFVCSTLGSVVINECNQVCRLPTDSPILFDFLTHKGLDALSSSKVVIARTRL